MNIVVEEMLDGRYLPEWLQLLEVRALLLGLVSTCTEGWLWLEIGQAVQSVELVLSVERHLALVIPELPVRVERVGLLLKKLGLWYSLR